MTSLFSVYLETAEGTHSIGYESVVACLEDKSLRSMFRDGQVLGARIKAGDLLVNARPITTWGQLCRQLVANASTILRLYPIEESE
jgi:hypothetical protein